MDAYSHVCSDIYGQKTNSSFFHRQLCIISSSQKLFPHFILTDLYNHRQEAVKAVLQSIHLTDQKTEVCDLADWYTGSKSWSPGLNPGYLISESVLSNAVSHCSFYMGIVMLVFLFYQLGYC